ncbi:MAG: redox-regulated ATPase YchF [Candidatus Bathyarchaeota archaeon]|nr:redox-regulated ATPase YchF [Candidatus Bathyarchaeota archaeon]
MPPLVGLVGKANVGKSTFFAAVTLKPVEIANFPFTTIKANRGVGYLRTPCVCHEFKVKDEPNNSACIDGVRLVPIDLIDTPGLIRGAHEGKGLGNQFLDEVRRADALIVVCDAAGSTDEGGQSCAPGTHDPIDDIKLFEEEFDAWLYSILIKDWERLARTAEMKHEEIGKHIDEKVSGLGITRGNIQNACERAKINPFKAAQWTKTELHSFCTELRKASKPLIIAANKADKEPALQNIEKIKAAGYMVIPTCAEAELALRRAAESGLVKYTPGDKDFTILQPEKLNLNQLKALESVRERVFKKWGGTGLQNAINEAFYGLLDMITVFPVEDAEKLTDSKGRVLPDCFLVPKGTTARQFASVVHTDLAKSFLFAVDARTKRRLGEAQVLKDKDVIQIVAAKSR